MEIRSDFLVIGSGLAGLSFAIKASRFGCVAIITKKNTTESSTNYVQGGIASVMDAGDSFDLHVEDTLKAGAGLCREDVVRFVVGEGPERIAELIHWGVEFSRKAGTESSFDLGKEGGHSRRRVLHAADSTGKEIERALIDKVHSIENIRIYENFLEGNRLQDIFMAEFKQGLTGNELLHNILTRARNEGVPNPRVYSHSLGLYLHEPGPLIGLAWEQERCPGRGDVRLEYNNTFTMELSVKGPLPEWGGQEVLLGMEEDVVFTREGCRPLDARQTEFYLV